MQQLRGVMEEDNLRKYMLSKQRTRWDVVMLLNDCSYHSHTVAKQDILGRAVRLLWYWTHGTQSKY